MSLSWPALVAGVDMIVSVSVTVNMTKTVTVSVSVSVTDIASSGQKLP